MSKYKVGCLSESWGGLGSWRAYKLLGDVVRRMEDPEAQCATVLEAVRDVEGGRERMSAEKEILERIAIRPCRGRSRRHRRGGGPCAGRPRQAGEGRGPGAVRPS